MKFTRILSLALVLVMAISLASCDQLINKFLGGSSDVETTTPEENKAPALTTPKEIMDAAFALENGVAFEEEVTLS